MYPSNLKRRLLMALCCMPLPALVNAQKQVRMDINPSAARHTISPFIYGTNDRYPQAGARRMGGNRITGYNWENNASNAGHDYRHNSDDYVPWQQGVPDSLYNRPGAAIVNFHNEALAGNAYSLVTLPMAGYVAKDKNGPVSISEAAPSARWVPVKTRKQAPLSLQPNVSDDAVYVDEELGFLLNKFGKSDNPRGIRGYSLDNEPCLWASSHPLLWGTTGVSANYLLNKSIETAKLSR